MTIGSLEIQTLLQQGIERHHAGDRPAASRFYRRVLEIAPRHTDAMHLAGLVEFQNGNLDEAELWIRQALQGASENAVILNNLAAVLLKKKDFSAAADVARKSISIQAINPDARKHLSAAVQQLGDNHAAVAIASEALDDAPTRADLRIHLGTILLAARRVREAHDVLLSALQAGVADPLLDLHLGAAQRQLGMYGESLATLNRALTAQPEMTGALINRGNALASLNRPDAALADFQKALEKQPRSAAALNGLGKALQILGHWTESLEALRLSWLCDEQQRGFDSNYLYATSLAPHWSRQQVAQVHRAWGQAAEEAISPMTHRRSLTQPSRITIGYVSPDFCSHATMRFFLPLLRNHDRQQFRIVCYSENPVEDRVSEIIRQHCDVWRSTTSVSDDEMAAMIQQDQVQILIDLAGHTAGNRLRVFARQPAPVQATFLGYPCTTGLSRIQWFLTDRFRETYETAEFYSEQMFCLPGIACCFEMNGDVPEVVEPPCRKNGFVTFGSTHRLEKISPDCLKLWARVLLAVPDSRLRICRDVVANEDVRGALLQRFAAAGISASRVDFQWEFAGNHLNVYSSLDLLLDVFPWGSGTTAWECSWLGVPIPTIQDCVKSSAATASLLFNSGFPELVAGDDQEYVSMVTTLSQNMEELRRIRFALRPAMQQTVCDAPKYAREFEATMRELWHHFQQTSATLSKDQEGCA
ncbi:MAG: tetratricopeptide repeat protein [Planctomycetota bacterium]